jgi:tripartite-type tricarboxylate transporter receptor subunit TctC
MLIFRCVLRPTAIAATYVMLLFPAEARAEYPDRLITAVVPFSPGGTTDVMARMMSAELGKTLGQTVIVENRAGGASIVGTRYVVSAQADGYTLLFTSSAATNAPAMFRNLPYDPIKDIQPVALYAQAPLMVAVSTTTVKATTLAEFISYLRANPGKLNASSSGNGTTLSAQLFLLKNVATAQIVPYKGSGEAVLAVAAGQVDFIIADALTLAPGLETGKIRALAVTAGQRLANFPDVPTSKETGMPSYLDTVPAALYVRAGTPPEIVERLNKEIHKIVTSPTMAEQFRKLSWTPVLMSVAQSSEWYVNEIAQWKEIVRKANIPLQN